MPSGGGLQSLYYSIYCHHGYVALLVEPDRCYFTKVAFGISRLVTLAINIVRATLMYQFILFFIVKQQHWLWM